MGAINGLQGATLENIDGIIKNLRPFNRLTTVSRLMIQ